MKKWYQSKTFWFNAITIAVGVIGELSQLFPVSQHPKLYVSVMGVGNIILRYLTKEPIA